MKRAISFVVFLAAAAALAACEPDSKPTVSLEQAKAITARFEGQGFTPPPRTIADITAILDQEKPDPAKAAAQRAEADRPAPADVTPVQLAYFYANRARAAGEVGRSRQRVEDLREAARLLRDARQPIAGIGNQLAGAEMTVSNINEALAIRLEQVRTMPDNQRGRLFSNYVELSRVYARRGDFNEANRWMTQADRLFQEAAGWGRGTSMQMYGDDWRSSILSGRATILEFSGRFPEAEATLREMQASISRARAASRSWPDQPPVENYDNWSDFTTRDLSRVLLRQGRLVEAEVEARRVLLSQLKRRGRYAQETGWMILNLAGVVHEQGRYAEAQKLGEAVLDIFENIGMEPTSLPIADARMRIALALNWQRKGAEALAQYEKVREGLADNPEMLERYLGSSNAYAFLLLRNNRTSEALPIFERSVQRAQQQFGANHYNTAEARGFFGVALARVGQSERALPELRSAVQTLLAPSRDIEDEEGGTAGKDQRRQQILEAYIGILADQHRSGADGGQAAAEAFRLADAIRGRSVQRALAASSARAAASDPALADLVRREQDAQKQIASLQGVLTFILSGAPEQRDPAALQSLRGQVDALRSARAAIREEIERRFPDYVSLIDPRPATVEQVRRHLRPDESLIATYIGRDRAFVWAVPLAGTVGFASVSLGPDELQRAVADLRRSLDPNAATLGEIPAFDVALANKLYAALLQPVEAGWKDAKSLLVVPHGALGQLPFSVLVTAPTPVPVDREGQALFASYKGVPFLAKTAAITQLPSVASLGSLRALPPPRGERQAFIGFGDPWFSPQQAAEAVRETQVAQLQTRGARTLMQTRGVPLVRRNAPATQNVDSAELAQLPRLSDTADEVRSIALALNADPTKDVFTGREANERRVRSMDLSNRKVVMFATHGLVPGDLNGLTQPALALSAPSVADIDGDGLLTLDEVLALKLNADWVVLSACNTATGDGAGAEAVSGLGRAFFYAGTRALLVSNWPVETTSARELTTDLFRRQAQNPMLSRAEAMRQAMVALIDGQGYVDPDSKQAVFSYAHPIFWAPFSLVGDGGGAQPGG